MLSVVKLLQKLTTSMFDYFCKIKKNNASEIAGYLDAILS
jgi:hypothetical protein